ncbi:pyridoxal-dependent decarboxylase [Frankia sp. Ag45/Mut15]|uniref:Pyridoxal-dependent decarboxylase n=1 Tax=Frankia umida TaxID=573489 RepID=A0ABT0JSN1_9ACTN|nr:pyridoxal-dependent decarboxylase [Frankia umida]MCK9874534.1 pyridoxal-dependent decarboxylase [Frankia umida]
MPEPHADPGPGVPEIAFGPADEPWRNSFGGLSLMSGPPDVTPPSSDPRRSYASIPEIPYGQFQLPASGLTEEQYAAAENHFRSWLEQQCRVSVGFQVSGDLDYQQRLGPYLGLALNNVGDPYQSGAYTHNSKILERAVLDYFASLWNARWPHRRDDPESYWGYSLTMGASEGNLYGLWNAREYLSGQLMLHSGQDSWSSGGGRYGPAGDPAGPRSNSYHPVIFYSQDTHYSLTKATRLLGVDTFQDVGRRWFPDENPLAPGTPWPAEVPSLGGADGDGTIDIDCLAVLVDFFASRGFPILVNLNYGSTFKGAYDDVEVASRTVHEICAKHGLDERPVHHDHRGRHDDRAAEEQDGSGGFDLRTGYWVHVDGALGAGYAPYLEMARRAGLVAAAPPVFDFRLPTVHSITASGHKWMGAPWPCGIFMTRTGFQMVPPREVEYTGSSDTTLAGSRNGFSPLLMWDYLARHSYDDQARWAAECDRMAAYAESSLRALETALGLDLWVARSPFSLTVRFRRPAPWIVQKYSLSYETTHVRGQRRPCAHLFTMRHVTRDLVDALVRDLRRVGAFAAG